MPKLRLTLLMITSIDRFESSALVVIDQGLDFAVRPHPRHSAVISLADDESTLKVEGLAIAADGDPDELRIFARCETKQLVAVKIDKIPVAVRMPKRAFGKDEAGRETLGFSRFEHLWQVIGRRHGYTPRCRATAIYR